MKKTIIFLFIILLVTSCNEQGIKPDYATEVDKVFEDWESSDPGAAMAIINGGKVEYARGYGMANLEYDIPITTKSVFRIASTSKQFTAACVVLLAEQNKLSLEDPLSKFFPEFPDYANSISIRHLLNHTSGIRDYLQLVYLAGYEEEDFYTDEDLMKFLIKQKDLNFIPGDEHLYSNSGYWLISQIVLKVTGMTMDKYAEQNIFKPLGMRNTHYHNNNVMIVPNRATGYSPTKSGYEISMTQLEMIGDGGIFTTVEDMAKWVSNFSTHKVGSKSFTQTMQTRGILNDGDTLKYALGLSVTKYKSWPVIRHGGSFVGFRAEMIRLPEKDIAIVVLANRSDAKPSRRANQIADILFGNPENPNKKLVLKDNGKEDLTNESKVYKAVQLKEFEGNYYSEELQVFYKLKIVGKELMLSINGNEISSFKQEKRGVLMNIKIGTFEFIKTDGIVTGFILTSGRVKNLRFDKKK